MGLMGRMGRMGWAAPMRPLCPIGPISPIPRLSRKNSACNHLAVPPREGKGGNGLAPAIIGLVNPLPAPLAPRLLTSAP